MLPKIPDKASWGVTSPDKDPNDIKTDNDMLAMIIRKEKKRGRELEVGISSVD